MRVVEQTHSPAKERSLQPRLCRLEVEVHLDGGPASLFGREGVGGQRAQRPVGLFPSFA